MKITGQALKIAKFRPTGRQRGDPGNGYFFPTTGVARKFRSGNAHDAESIAVSLRLIEINAANTS